MKKIGLDIGTKNIVLSYKDKGETVFKREVNGFFIFENPDKFAKNILISQKVPFIEDADRLVALGSKAEDISYAFGHHLKRPMERGVLSVSEKDAMKIMAVIITSMIGDPGTDSVLYYSIPADAINEKTNVAYHQKIMQAIIDKYSESHKHKIDAHPINEARAIVLSQSDTKTAIGISFGAGMVNVSYCLFGLPVYEFSIVGSGDWIDYQSAKVTGNLEDDRPKVLVTRAKEGLDLTKGAPEEALERAIYYHYTILLERVAKAIAAGFRDNEKKARAPAPMPVICAGGTSSPNGFIELFKEVFSKTEMPFEIGEITKAKDPLYSVAEGCMIAAEMHE